MEKIKILPYYKDKSEWSHELDNWIKEKEKTQKVTKPEIEEYFFSAFSCANYQAYKNGIQLLKTTQNIDCRFYVLAQKALELNCKGKYTKAKHFSAEAAEIISQEKSERLYFFQLYKEIRLKSALEKIKPIKSKLKYLELKYFEISGNILYSSDILGVKLFLKYKAKHNNSPLLTRIKETIDEIYENIKYFKGDLNTLELYKKNNELPALSKLSTLVFNNENLYKLDLGGIHLIILSKLLATGMYMQSSLALRKLAKEYYIKNKCYFFKKYNVHYLYSVRACLEESIPICLNGFTHPERYQTALQHSKLYTKQNNRSLEIQLQKNDGDYANYIHQKNIAIVGPIDTGVKNGNEIDDYDIVIRLNTINSKLYPKEIFGTKTSSAYFVRDHFFKTKNELLQDLSSIDYISFHTIRNDELLNLIENNNQLRTTIRYHERVNNIFFSGYPNLIQRTILDILRFKPKSIKIFNANLWLQNIQSEYYIYKQEFYPANLILHDIYSNFILTKNLYNNGYINADKTLSSILNMSYEQYKTSMINNYGK